VAVIVKNRKKVCVLDSSFFINIGVSQVLKEKCFTTPEVVDELKDSRSKILFEVYLSSSKIVIRSAPEELIKEVMEKAESMGLQISKTDASVVALALLLKKEGYFLKLFSDDFDLMSVAEAFGLECKPVTKKNFRGAARKIRYCPVCGRSFSPGFNKCPVCGVKLRVKLKFFRRKRVD